MICIRIVTHDQELSIRIYLSITCYTYVTLRCTGGLRGAAVEDERGKGVPSWGAGEVEIQDSGAPKEANTKVFSTTAQSFVVWCTALQIEHFLILLFDDHAVVCHRRNFLWFKCKYSMILCFRSHPTVPRKHPLLIQNQSVIHFPPQKRKQIMRARSFQKECLVITDLRSWKVT